MQQLRRKIGARLRARVRAGLGIVLLLALGACAALPIGQTPPSHVVRPGDTLAGIAEAYGLEPEQVARANRIADADRIHVGQRIVLPHGARLVHRVRPGESLRDIALRYRVPESTIARTNRIRDPRRLEVGRRLVLPREATLPPAPRATPAPAPAPRAPAPELVRAGELLDAASDDYRAARFESALERAREADRLLEARGGAPALRARAAFVSGSALAGMGDEEQAVAAFGRVLALDPDFEPPPGWLSPRLEALYRTASAD